MRREPVSHRDIIRSNQCYFVRYPNALFSQSLQCTQRHHIILCKTRCTWSKQVDMLQYLLCCLLQIIIRVQNMCIRQIISMLIQHTFKRLMLMYNVNSILRTDNLHKTSVSGFAERFANQTANLRMARCNHICLVQ